MITTRRAERRGATLAADAAHEAIADAVFETLGGMKGVAMKLGQMMAFIDFDADVGTNGIYRRRLNALLDQAPPTDTAAIEESVTEQYGARPIQFGVNWLLARLGDTAERSTA